jgi:hypothetical protein
MEMLPPHFYSFIFHQLKSQVVTILEPSFTPLGFFLSESQIENKLAEWSGEMQLSFFNSYEERNQSAIVEVNPESFTQMYRIMSRRFESFRSRHTEFKLKPLVPVLISCIVTCVQRSTRIMGASGTEIR